MKKLIINLFCAIVYTVIICGCVASTNKPTTVLYKSTEGIPLIDVTRSKDFDAKEYVNSEATQKLNIELLDSQYDLTYSNSADLALCEYSVDVYSVENVHDGKILIDTKTGMIIKYSGLPYSDLLVSESDYVSFIQDIIGSRYNLSELALSIATDYYIFTENGMEHTQDSGFHLCAENEMLGAYIFYFTPNDNSIKTSEHITAQFYRDVDDQTYFILEIYPQELSDAEIKKASSQIESIHQEVETFLKSSLASDYIIHDIDYTDTMLFQKEGSIYVLITSTISYSISTNSNLYTYTAQTITELDI